MASVREIVAQIEQLSPAEVAEIRDWLEEREAEAWDQQIERDAASGTLDKLFEQARADGSRWNELFARPAPSIERMAEEALAEHRAGRTMPLDPDEL